ncbi:hypothetical protein [Asanoa siamensis]|uniref:Secreted protein n=1 Tax=Asanoa siamensis TaxID=926357 RepID=A0ABQ4CJE5_9ACTN|nr:hypothetical protein [Asanoa siamensis]GIF71416.1 hypothetical protein Asi02nite_09340 [Asanoa siamensis]
MKPFTHRALVASGLAAAALLAFGGLARAEPEGAGAIRACANKHTGVLRVPTHGGCGPFENVLAWNIRGPRGPAGVLGAGLSVDAAVSVPAGSQGTSVVANCPEGMVATGGGVALSTPALDVLIDRPEPATGGPLTGWRADFSSTSSLPEPAIVYAVCYPSR